MLRTILTATALLCMSQAAFAQELTAEQRNACMGDYEKYCKGVTPGGGRIIACLAKENDKLTPGLQEGAGGGREEMRGRRIVPAGNRRVGQHVRRQNPQNLDDGPGPRRGRDRNIPVVP